MNIFVMGVIIGLIITGCALSSGPGKITLKGRTWQCQTVVVSKEQVHCYIGYGYGEMVVPMDEVLEIILENMVIKTK